MSTDPAAGHWEQETARRRRKFQQVIDTQGGDPDRMAHLDAVEAHRAERRAEAVVILDELERSVDVEAFRAATGQWSKRPGFDAFGGVNGQMFLNQVVNAAHDDQELGRLLIEVFRPPADLSDARRRIGLLLAFVESVKKGAHPAPKRVPYVASFFWSLRSPESWPCMWTSAEEMLARLGWLVLTDDHAENYVRFATTLLSLDVGLEEAGHALFWLRDHPFTGLDPSLVQRCRENVEWREADGTFARPADAEQAERNARAVIGELGLLASDLEGEVAGAIGRSVKRKGPRLDWAPNVQRADEWVDLRAGGGEGSMRVWASAAGVAVGLSPDWVRPGWDDEAGRALRSLVPSGMEYVKVSSAYERLDREATYDGGAFFLCRWFPGEKALDRIDFRDDVLAAASELQPAFDELSRLIRGATEAESPRDDHGLAARVAEFRAARGYPNAKDDFHNAERKAMAELLRPEELAVIDLGDFRAIYNGNRYGSPGPQSVLNRSLRDASPVELEEFAEKLGYLLWDETDPPERRIDRLLDPADKGIKGLGEAVIMKLLAVTHPDRFVSVYPYAGDMGKLRLMRLIELPGPGSESTRGQKQVQANDAIRQRLDPYFPGDPWGQGQFLYWLKARHDAPARPEADVLGDLADALLVDRSFLEDIVELLRDKGQVVFFGPPGTGKTYLAQRLAAALAPDPSRRMLVQFHPSSSYEDFFEGYRPEGADDGQLSYRLTAGPLARLAARADLAPTVDHIMVIDEINRANLPRVLGELLFLLEYRDHRVMTLYRPEDGFELPPNMYFIGTMNTADRSIALIDAALRRRFHFIPFFPHEGPMAGLLDRWLDRNREPPWVGELVEMANHELTHDLGGPHLQIGPSHFMRQGLNERSVARIWTYNVLPYVEDQLFGQSAKIREYNFDRVLARYKEQLTPGGLDGAPIGPGAEEAGGAPEPEE